MGLQFSRKIYDPEERYLDLKTILQKYKVEVSDWYKDSEGRLVCEETTSVHSDMLNINYKEIYPNLLFGSLLAYFSIFYKNGLPP